ncbi:MAG: DUF1016 family protein [Fimbriimonadaceae bacterium]|nr:DUF1016 family protein [Fimbriimonadaceae bacterium]
MNHETLPADYPELLRDLQERIRMTQIRAAVGVNRELVLLYWRIGREILVKQAERGWGAAVIDRLAADLRRTFPDQKGFSARNLKYMRAFAAAWPEEAIVQQAVAQLPWGHNLVLLTKLDSPDDRIWYTRQSCAHGWSRSILTHQIETGLIRRQGAALTNFERTLPGPQSELAQQITKDPYTFDFLTLGPAAHERDLERGLLGHVREFLLELGVGFAFVGSQYHLDVGSQDFYLDLLFYHYRLRCFVVIDLKVDEFRPEYAGKMNFYLSVVDDLLRTEGDQPSIGILLCKGSQRLVVEYALRDLGKPIGVSAYDIVAALPDQLQGSLPTVEQLEQQLRDLP